MCFLKSEPDILPIMFNNNNLTNIAIRKIYSNGSKLYSLNTIDL